MYMYIIGVSSGISDDMHQQRSLTIDVARINHDWMNGGKALL